MLMALVPTAFAASKAPDFSDGWTALTSADGGKELNGGNYYLSEDITIDTSLKFIGDVVLDLNGHVIKLDSEIYGGSASSEVILLLGINIQDEYCPINFTLQDSNPTAKHYFSKQSDGLWKWEPTVTEATEGYELVEGGVITGGTGVNNNTFGGGIYVDRSNYSDDNPYSVNVNINGGNIVGCKAIYGGGIFNCEGNVTMNGGKHRRLQSSNLRRRNF